MIFRSFLSRGGDCTIPCRSRAMGSIPARGPVPASINLQVSLRDQRETVEVAEAGTIADLKMAVQLALGQGFLKLAALDGRPLNPMDSLRFSGLQDGDSIAAVAQQPKIASTSRAFALWCVGGDRIVTWGDPQSGGDSIAITHQLHKVQKICGTDYAFAALLADGSVVTWGVPDYGGDSSRVQVQLRNDLWRRQCFCCDSSRWDCGDMGSSTLWR